MAKNVQSQHKTVCPEDLHCAGVSNPDACRICSARAMCAGLPVIDWDKAQERFEANVRGLLARVRG